MTVPEWTGELVLFLTCVAVLALGVTAWERAKRRERRVIEREFECLAKEHYLQDGFKEVEERANYQTDRERQLNEWEGHLAKRTINEALTGNEKAELRTLQTHVNSRSQIPFWMETPGLLKKSDFVSVGEKK